MSKAEFVRTLDGRYINANRVAELWVCAPPEEHPEWPWEVIATLNEKDDDGCPVFEAIAEACCQDHAQAYLDRWMGYAAPEPAPIPKGSN